VAIKNIARACGDEISEMQPLLDARLEDGSRVAAMFPPCAVTGPILTIRKFTRRYSVWTSLRLPSAEPTRTCLWIRSETAQSSSGVERSHPTPASRARVRHV
jgi:hypothetical protein